MSYSQHDEEAVIVEYFAGQVGRFLDIGANDLRLFSNTLRLAELGWCGLAVEADPYAFCRLLRECGRFPNVMPMQAVIMPERGIVPFWSAAGDGVSTADDAHRRKWAAASAFEPMYAAALTVADLLERFPGPFEFMNIDIEGSSLDVLRQLPLAHVRMVCVEHDGRAEAARDYCAAAGLTRELLRNAENLIMGR